ncbi:MAG: alpha-L-fucosidase [Colwellia sp.]|nr:alpha-L-fucosidase [Colwellia sp.]
MKSLVKKISSTVVCMLMAISLSAASKDYQATWESLDAKPIAPWFEQAKFGIFIHWGPYSVPAWSPKGTYSEWYQFWLQGKGLFGNGDFKGDEVYQYHIKTYGENFDYYQFAPLFTADLFDADKWASLFENAGAKYVVLTSKHHDGFTLWPNKEANDRGFAWNSMEVGAKRDLVGELSAAVKKTDMKMGLYYSLYEWYHPLWLTDKDKFVSDHMMPQFKDLVESYEPDLIWADGDWEITDEEWRSKELLAWLYNDSKVKDNVVVNDRWGDGIRFNHSDYYSSEYGGDKDFDKPWEEARGMGFSFGYNQNENAKDYNSTRALVLILVDIVSRGGNLLLDIGPDGRGNIAPIMEERLLEMGDWLKVNGEAIYKTTKWRETTQWSEGDRTVTKGKHYLGGDYILKQTLNPDPGKAIKEVFYTAKGSDVYAITATYPKGTLLIKNVVPSKGTVITLLGHNNPLEYSYENGKLRVKVPFLTYDELPAHHAWAFKITHAK